MGAVSRVIGMHLESEFSIHNFHKHPCFWSNISNPTMRTGLDFKYAQFDQVLGGAKPRTGSKCEDLESSPVRIGGFGMKSYTNKSPLKMRWIHFDPVQGLN
jgi:hypothetical protein